MAIYASILFWKISWTKEPGRLQSMRVSKSQTGLSTAQYNSQVVHFKSTSIIIFRM